MKHILLSFFLVFAGSLTQAQTATSIANGSWLNPFNWSCTCVPIAGYTVVINHAIVLDTDFGYTSGSITINTGGSLIQDATPRSMLVGANFTNNGVVDFHAMLNSGGTTTNNANAQLTLSAFTNSSGFNNYGQVTLDSFYNTSLMTNLSGAITVGGFLNDGTLTNNAKIIVDSFFNDGIITNNDTIDVSSFYNNKTINNYKDICQQSNPSGKVDSMYNNSTFINHPTGIIKIDSITNGILGIFHNYKLLSFGDFTNLGKCYNNADMVGSQNFWNNGLFENNAGAMMSMAISFYNGDTLISSVTAHYKNNGIVTIGDSWFNTDTISGNNTGSFSIQNFTSSSGPMIGSFDFCDATPAPSSPYIDFYTNYVDPNITYCQMVGTSALEDRQTNIQVYPNPIANELTITTQQEGILNLQLFNSLGQIVLQQQLTAPSQTLSVSNLDTGLYWLSVTTQNGELLHIEQLVKQ